jgi:hypothetical protein
MAMFSTIVLSPLFLENDNFCATRLLNNPGPHESVGKGRSPDSSRVAITNGQHLVKGDFSTDLTLEPLNHDLVTGSNSVLFSASFYDREHCQIRIPPATSAGVPRDEIREASQL